MIEEISYIMVIKTIEVASFTDFRRIGGRGESGKRKPRGVIKNRCLPGETILNKTP